MTTGLLKGNCLEQLLLIPDNSVDSVVTDPPYELNFMNKGWDASGIAYNVEVWKQCFRVLKPGGHLLAFGGTRTYHRIAVAIEDAGFEIRDSIHWTYGSGFPKSMNISKAIDKGMGENRQRQHRFVEWMRSTGLNANQINEAIGKSDVGSHYLRYDQPQIATADLFDLLRPLLPEVPEEIERLVAERTGIEWFAYKNREVVGSDTKARSTTGKSALPSVGGETEYQTWDITAPATDEAKKWQGWGTALKPSHEPVVVARKPVIGTVANNVLTYGTGALNIDGTRVGNEVRKNNINDFSNQHGNQWGNGEPIAKLGESEVVGRWPANTILTHSPECVQIGTRTKQMATNTDFTTEKQADGWGTNRAITTPTEIQSDVWECVEGCPVLDLDEQSGIRPGGVFPAVRGRSEIGAFGAGGTHKDKPNQARTMGDSGGASRYFTNTGYDDIDFPPFIYQAKASTRERNAGLGDLETKQTVGGGGLTEAGDKFGSIKAPAKNFHPTVKPVSLMRHLVRLVTPQGGLVLDPFLGSGTTAVAAVLENCQWVGCELTEDYWGIIEGRTEWAQTQVETPTTTQEALF